MRELKNTTQQAKNFIRRYLWALENAPKDNIFKMYNKPSQAKIKAFNDCISFKAQLEGYNGIITGGNCDKFNYAFKYKENGTEYLVYITPQNDYKIALTGEEVL